METTTQPTPVSTSPDWYKGWFTGVIVGGLTVIVISYLNTKK